jgi:hypothetical protein
MIWRREKWFDLAVEVLELIYGSAEKTRNAKLLAESAWELAYQRKHPQASTFHCSDSQQPLDLRKASTYCSACQMLVATTTLLIFC